ncbi:MAG: AAA family ATPase [Clostridium sp.]|nr:AAA family ATPase [Clostridium sp.]
MEYEVTLLGIPGVFRDQEPVRFPYRKAEGIFYYLCVEKHTNRDELVSLFWGAGDEASGRKNLRQALFQLRKLLGEELIVLQGRNDLKLNQRVEIRTDWDMPDRDFSLCQERFLDFFYLKDCPEFEEWVEEKRNQQIARILREIKAQLEEPSAARNPERLRLLIDTWKHWSPWDEEMVLTGMRLYGQAEKYDWGAKLYQEYIRRLREDLDEEPSHQAVVLFQTLLHRKEVSSLRSKKPRKEFFGRLAEIQTIDEQIFLFLNDEDTKSVIIEGEVGVGKTALMRQIFEMDHKGEALELYANCYGAESDVPLRALRDCFQCLERLHAKHKISLSGEEERLIRRMLSGEERRVNADEKNAFFSNSSVKAQSIAILEAEILNLFRDLASQRKILLYIDSLHWMDSVSRRLLQRMMVELGNERLFLTAACRTDGKQAVRDLLLALNERALVTTIHLSCFTEEEMGELMKRDPFKKLAGENGGRELFLRTEGNPLALMDLLSRSGQKCGDGQENPSRIDMMIQLRLERLSERQRRTLEALSVCGEEGELEPLALLTKSESLDLVEELEHLMRAGLVTETEKETRIFYQFTHQYYRDYVYSQLSQGKKRLWHTVAAHWYEKAGELRTALYHYERSSERQQAEAVCARLELEALKKG